MKNIKDLYYEKELLNIVSDQFTEYETTTETMRLSAVAVNLYYSDTVRSYLEYFVRVPQEIDLYIVSSNETVISIARDFAARRANVTILRKKNQGRDISALLVALRERLTQYRYICFIHDKKPNHEYLRKDIEFWIYNLWDNTLKSETYIKNILGILDKQEIGLLVPPSPIGDYKDDWYANAWFQNLENVKKLAERMELNADIVYDKPPIALGTVFWANTKALRKLFDIRWDYGDFPDEPMPIDGTISHAIERILPYVAQDAGYGTGVVMTKEYAEKLLLKTQKMMEESFQALWERFRIRNVCQLTHYAAQEKAAEEIFATCGNVYLYGAGDYGRRFLTLLKSWGYEPEGFVVSDGNRTDQFVEGYRVYELKEIRSRENSGFIICTNYNLQDEIENSLIEKGFHRYFKIILG